MKANTGEARLVADRVEQLIRMTDVDLEEIGVIAPHRMQNGAICRALQEKLGLERATRIHVDTVERFQGQEKEIIIFSFGCDSESAGAKEGKANFLGDPKRTVTVPVVLPRCPHCLKSNTVSYSSEQNGDGSKSQHRKCRDCGGCFIAVFEYVSIDNEKVIHLLDSLE